MGKRTGRAVLLAAAEYLGATITAVGGRWYIHHYGVGDVIEGPIGHPAWDCLGHLLGVAVMRPEHGGHGIGRVELQAAIRVPWDRTRDGSLVLPNCCGTADAVFSAIVAAEERATARHSA